MAWQTPKTDWAANDGVLSTDLNRIEGNTQYNKDTHEADLATQLDASEPVLWGFDYGAGGPAEVYTVRLSKGGATSQSAVSGFFRYGEAGSLFKLLSADSWVAGSSNAACKAPGAAYALNTWYYIFALYNPATQVSDFALDDSSSGANISGSTIEAAGFTMWRLVGAVKTSDLISPTGIIPTSKKGGRVFLAGDDNCRKFTVPIPYSTVGSASIDDTNGVQMTPPISGANTWATFLDKGATEDGPRHVIWPLDFGNAYYPGIGKEVQSSPYDPHSMEMPLSGLAPTAKGVRTTAGSETADAILILMSYKDPF